MAQGAEDSIEDRIAKRIPVLKSIAYSLNVAGGLLPSESIILRPARIPKATTAYFLLNVVYKDWRIEDGHWTEAPKIAALQCMAIMTLEPFRPVNRNNTNTIAEARCNEIYALACAAAAIRSDPSALKANSNFYLRLLDVISASRSQTLEPYVTDLDLQISREFTEYRLALHPDDKRTLNSLITIFELIHGDTLT